MDKAIFAIQVYNIGAMATPIAESKNIYGIRAAQEKKFEEFNKFYRPLLGSDAFVNNDGDIAYITYHDIPADLSFSPTFIPISQGSVHGEIYTREPEIRLSKEIRVNHVHGGDEKAIRNMDEILEGKKAQKAVQIQTIGKQAHRLFDLFTNDFASITDNQLSEAQQKTLDLLSKTKLNPHRVVDEETKRIEAWLIKGSSGEDSLGRRNKLIATMALSAAYRRALEEWKGVGPIRRKFATMREALIFERQVSRQSIDEVIHALRPEALPSHTLFKHPMATSTNEGIVLGMLGHLKFKLELSRVKPYRKFGHTAAQAISSVMEKLQENPQDRRAIVESHVFVSLRSFLTQHMQREETNYYPPR
jgi:hypothetical protein